MARDLGNSIKNYKIEYENYRDNVEPYFFWMVEFLKDFLTYDVEKVEDIFTSSETSSFWSTMEQRKGAQQEKASQYLGIIGNMIKNMHPIIRELRIMDERWEYYQKSKKGDKGAEMALKDLWITIVEGGSQSPKSVYGMSIQVGFVTLPDLFFEVTPKSTKDVDKAVNAMESVNDTVKNVLKRKLYQYMEWKEQTEKEIATRRNFTLKYLHQHFNSIKLYMNWVRPYLKNIKKLQQGETLDSVDLITASEGSVVDLEILGTKRIHEANIGDLGYHYKKYFPVIQIKMHWRTRPAMMYQQEYQKGALHLGRVLITFNAFALTKKQLDTYKEKKDEEDMELLSSINASMDALKEDLDKYLKEGIKDKDKTEKSKKGEKLPRINALAEPFTNLGKGLSSIIPYKKGKTKGRWSEKEEKKVASLKSSVDLQIIYEIFKKAHKMVQW